MDTSTTPITTPTRGIFGKVLIGILIVLILIGISLVSSYNSLVKANEGVTTAWAQVETQYQRRLDLIPNLVESTKGIMTQEQEVFTAIANARQGYAGARTVDEKAAAAGQVDSAISRLLVITENYPQLKSSENMMRLTDELAGTENRISVERSRYNEIVRDYNISVKSFPKNLLAGMFGFLPHKTFEAEAAAATVPTVKF